MGKRCILRHMLMRLSEIKGCEISVFASFVEEASGMGEIATLFLERLD